MKNTKKLLALLLTLAMLTALLAGCGSDDSKKLIGTWTGTISFADMGEDLDSDLAELQEMMDISKLQVDMSLVLREDGTYSMSITPESAEIAIDVMIAEMRPYLEKMIEDQLAAEGINMTLDEFFEKMQKKGVKNIICTDISRDGAMKGTNRQLYSDLSQKFSLDIMASGGVSTLEDIKALADMNIYGAILGKALYTGAIDLADALKIVKEDKA